MEIQENIHAMGFWLYSERHFRKETASE